MTHETEKSKKENGKIKCGTTEKRVCKRDMEKRKEKRDQQWKSLVDHKPRIWPAPQGVAAAAALTILMIPRTVSDFLIFRSTCLGFSSTWLGIPKRYAQKGGNGIEYP